MDAADPLRHAVGSQLLGLGRREDPAVHLVLACLERPGLPFGEVGRLGRDVDEACAAKACLSLDLAVELAPDLEALHGKRQFAQIAMLLATPAPVATALLAGDHAFLDDGDREVLLCERMCSGD